MSDENFKKYLKEALKIWDERIREYEKERNLSANVTEKFKLKQRIEDCLKEINRIEAQINSLEEKQPFQENNNLKILFRKELTNNDKKIKKTQWQYLESRPQSWRKQLYIKETRIRASVIYSDMKVNQETPEETADNWDLPLAAIEEIIEYCENNQELLKQEAREEGNYLEERGISLEPKTTNG